jgi:tight adherence protein C
MELLMVDVLLIQSAALAFCLGYLVTEDRIKVKQRAERVLVRLGPLAPRSKREIGRIKQSLVQAGRRSPAAQAVFYGLAAASTVLLPTVLGLSLAMSGQPIVRALPIVAAAAIMGHLAPRWALRSRQRARQETLRRALPDALDLMVICVKAGIGLDQTLAKVSARLRDTGPEMAEELDLVLLELRAGRPRAEAFRALAERTGLDEIRSLVTALIQADRFGTSLSDALLTSAEEFRTQRRQQAEEWAAKLPVKLVFPIFFFIFPVIFVVTVVPAVLRILRELLPIMK